MYTGQEHQAQTHWEAEDPPDPTVARDGVEFLGELRVLLRWSGLSYQELEERAFACGGFIPEGAVAETLRNNALPGEELLVPLLWALGCDDDTVEMWLWARDRVAGDRQPMPHSPPMPHHVPMPHHAPMPHSGGGDETVFRQAVQERGDQHSWRGVHRQAGPADAAYRPKRLRAKASAAGERGGRWWSRAMIGMVSLGAVALTVGVAVITFSGDEAEAPPQSREGVPCCAQSRSPDPATPLDPSASLEATEMTAPTARARPSTTVTARPTITTQDPPPQPEDPPPAPTLAGSASSDCEIDGANFVVEVSVSVTLSGGASGTDPVGRAGQGGLMESFTVNTSGGSSFNGVARVNVGSADTQTSGSIQWNVAVTVAGSPVTTGGSEGFSCTPSAPAGG